LHRRHLISWHRHQMGSAPAAPAYHMSPGFLFPVSLARRREGSQAIRSGAWRSEPFTICHAMSHDSVLALHRSKRTVTMSHTLPDQWFRSRWVTSSDNKYRVASQSSIQHILSVQRDHLVNLKRPPNPNSPAFLSCTIQESLPRLRLFPRSDLNCSCTFQAATLAAFCLTRFFMPRFDV